MDDVRRYGSEAEAVAHMKGSTVMILLATGQGGLFRMVDVSDHPDAGLAKRMILAALAQSGATPHGCRRM